MDGGGFGGCATWRLTAPFLDMVLLKDASATSVYSTTKDLDLPFAHRLLVPHLNFPEILNTCAIRSII